MIGPSVTADAQDFAVCSARLTARSTPKQKPAVSADLICIAVTAQLIDGFEKRVGRLLAGGQAA